MFARIHSVTRKLLVMVSSIALLLMMLLTFADVIGRYGLNRSIFGTSEIIEMLMVVTVFAGMVFITISNEHIVVSLFDEKIKSVIPRLHYWCVHLTSLAALTIMTGGLWASGIDSFTSGKRLVVLDFPQWILPMTAAILSSIGLLLFVGQLMVSDVSDVSDHQFDKTD